MPVSLARGTVSTGKFKLNAHGFYSILIGEEQSGTAICNVGLETRRISSIGGVPVYRYKWLDDESRSMGRNTIAGPFLGGFEGKPGNYDLEIEVVSDTGCLDAGKPRLCIIASNDDFARWNNRYDSAVWISLISGSLGLTLLIISIRERFRRPSTDSCSLNFLEPPRSLHNYPARHSVKAALWMPLFSRIGLLYSQILLLLIISAILVFHFAWGYDHRSHGLSIITYSPESSKLMGCVQGWVRVKSSNEWYLNFKRIEPDNLRDALRAQIGAGPSCIVFFDAEPDVPYFEAIHAIDLIKETPRRVVLLTPETRRSRVP